MLATLIIALATVLTFILSVLFFPSVGRLKLYPFIPLAGGIAMLFAGAVTLSDVFECFTANTSVNPIKLLVLFLSMTVYSLILDRTGFFAYVSAVVLKRAGHSPLSVFIALYAVISLLTVFTSNDIVILTFTPFICHFCRSARLDALPYLIMEFVAANTWSLLLLIGNPTNIYISGAFDIGFAEYFCNMALPTVAAGTASLGIMLILFRGRLKGRIDADEQAEAINDKPLMLTVLIHLLVCIVMLAVSQYINIEMWIISLALALSATVCSLILLLVRHKALSPLTSAIRSMPFELAPFVVGMFVIVLGLDGAGITDLLANALGKGNGVLSYGLASLLSANLLNNIPMSVLFSRVLAKSASAPEIFATIAGSNIGAFITPVGALAGIMWSKLVKQNGIKLSVGKFVTYGSAIGIPSMLAALAVIMLVQ